MGNVGVFGAYCGTCRPDCRLTMLSSVSSRSSSCNKHQHRCSYMNSFEGERTMFHQRQRGVDGDFLEIKACHTLTCTVERPHRRIVLNSRIVPGKPVRIASQSFCTTQERFLWTTNISISARNCLSRSQNCVSLSTVMRSRPYLAPADSREDEQ